MKDYQVFPISNFRTGFDESTEPWLLPRDAYQTMINAHLYRGILEKIDGYTLYAHMTYRNIMSLGTPDGMTKTFTITLPSAPVTNNFFAYGTIVVGSTAETFSYDSDASSTLINLTGNAGGTGTVNLTTNVVSITFNTAPPLDARSSIFFIWDSASAGNKAIMGIKPYFTDNGSQEILVFDQVRMGKIVGIMGILASNADCNTAVQEIPHDYYQSAIITGDAMTTTFTGTLAGHPFVPGTLVWTEFTSSGAAAGRVITDNGTGGLIGTNVTSGAVNYVTGSYTITFAVAPTSGNYFDSTTGIYGNFFTGDISNFFSLTNYQYKAFFTNNVDHIFYYDGTSIHYLPTNLSIRVIPSSGGVPTFGTTGYDISKCLHVFTYRERLLLISPTIDGILFVSVIQWSTAGLPLDFTNGESIQASTSQPIRAIGYITTNLIVRFSNSERVLTYTNDAFAPFRFDSTNNLWACDAPYSTINYDSWFSTVGKPAIVGSDGVNVKRVDELIPDFTDPDRLPTQPFAPYMSQTSIQQCYGERFDDTKEGWLCYASNSNADSSVAPSDHVLAYNYLDGTYATYSFPFSCLGYGQVITASTWGTTYSTWEDTDIDWGSYVDQKDSLLDLAGDHFDKVYSLNTGNTLGDGTTPVLMDVVTKNFNPFIEDGQLARLGYVDLLVTASSTSKLRVQFFLNDEMYIDADDNFQGFYQETKLVFTPTDAMSPTRTQSKVWKRIYVGAVGKIHTIRFYQSEDDFPPKDPTASLDQDIYIHAMNLYMKPAGRIFN